MSVLQKIIEHKRLEIISAKEQRPLAQIQSQLKSQLTEHSARLSFCQALRQAVFPAIIAEIKKASPSKGILRGDFNPVKIAMTYQAHGAAAVSVLTDERFFEGKLEYIKMVKESISLPILRKDFIIDEYQIYESVACGADAILLIADLLSDSEMTGFYQIAASLGLDVLLEVHNEEDLEKAIATGGDIIGINNRDLHTFKVDLTVTQKLIRLVPAHKIKVSESGIKSYEDVMFLKSLGINAILIGEAFMESPDIAAKMHEIMRY